mgnify:CR=1 FL=1
MCTNFHLLIYNIDFFQARNNVEKFSNKPNLSIYDIYDLIQEKFKISNEIKEFLLKEEIKLESRLLKPRKDFLEIYNYALKYNKKIIATSDMYLPSSVLKNILDINGFDKKIDKVFIGEFGQDSTGLTLIYLMEDGSVSYTRLFKKNYNEENNLYFTLNYTSDENNNYYFSIDGTYDKINDIVNIYNASYSIPNGGGAGTVIAATKDGSFYDLSKFMQF